MYNKVEQLIRHQGWARFSKIDYLSKKHLEQGLSKEEIQKTAVDEEHIFNTPQSFNSTWNLFEKIKGDLDYVVSQ